ncbi:hypothetical protein JB92DRAFT_2148406 [Gautieria morchelliformis]|nr:hypothetical protein JB92DRAFT_2148406 [Gautieria morchelliformis]
MSLYRPRRVYWFPWAPRVITPTLDEGDELHLDPALRVRRTLSPYAPMPLQPIFHLEPQCKAIHDTIEPISYFHPATCDFEDTKSLAIDPPLIPQPPVAEYEAPAPVAIPFTRGSIASEDFWPPSLASKLSAPVHHNFCPPLTIGIPLEIAKQYAQEFRASSPHALSEQFLLSFMGQSDKRVLWLCYIRGCGKQLARKSHMIDHIRMHLDERVYACEYCPQTFLRKADCKRHTAAHNPENAFHCELCAKSFGRKDLLTRHKRKCESTFGMTSSHRVVGDTKRLSRKRKGIQGISILNTPTTQNVGHVAESVLSLPDHIKRNNRGVFWEFEGNDKENIPPSPEDRLRVQKRARGLF